jgi:hypothetical protein
MHVDCQDIDPPHLSLGSSRKRASASSEERR